MKEVIRENIKKLFFVVLCTSFIMFLILNSDKKIIEIFFEYFKWIFNFFIGDYGLSSNGSKIVLFNFNNDTKIISIGPKYLYTLFTTLSAIILSFLFALLLNFLIVVKQSNIALIIKNVIEWFSTIHILIIGIVIYSIFQNDISYLFGIMIISIGSNAFYELSSLQYADLSALNSKDFIIAARAWGDKVWKHMRRSFSINSINQLFSLWIVFFSNCMIFEMIFQKSGLGYLLWKYFLNDSGYKVSSNINSSAVVNELNIFLTISMLIILTISSLNALRNIMLKYLIEYRR